MNSKTNRGFILPILIIVALLILGIVAYFFSPKSTSLVTSTVSPTVLEDQMVTWKTYRDIDSKFTFKYPGSYDIKNDKSWMYDSLSLSNGGRKIFEVVKITDSASTAEGYIKEIYDTEIENKISSASLSAINETMVSDKKAYYFEKTDSNMLKEIYVDLDSSSILRIKIEDNDIYIDQILSTFRFAQ